MTPLIIKIPQCSDRAVINNFLKILEDWDVPDFNGALPGNASISGTLVDEDGNLEVRWSHLLNLESSLLISLSFTLGSISFTYRRGAGEANSAIYDDIYITINQSIGFPDPNQRLELIAGIKNQFKAFDPDRTLQIAAGELGAQSAALHESTLTRLEEVATGLVKKVADQQIKLEAEYREKREMLDEQSREFEKKLNEDFKRNLDRVDLREKELNDLRASIDDRDNTHARRETRNKLLEDVKTRINNFGVTRTTESKRLPVLGAIFLIFFILSLFGLSTWFEINDYHRLSESLTNPSKTILASSEIKLLALTKTDLYILWGRLSLVILSLIGFALYFVRWQNRWAEQHAGSEFQLQQFYLDVNRANWVVESGLEWHKETNSPIPNELLDRLTHNLFKAAAEPPPAIHPADELASALLGSASRLNLKAGDSEIVFNRPGKIPDKT